MRYAYIQILIFYLLLTGRGSYTAFVSFNIDFNLSCYMGIVVGRYVCMYVCMYLFINVCEWD